MPKVSVFLTSFNHEKYIGEAIESVLNQTFTDLELVIWDDASTDGSWSIINEYSDPRIRAFRNEEQMCGSLGINKFISEIAEGEFIAIHHSDDVWESQKLAKQVKYLEAHSAVGAVFTHVDPINEEGQSFIPADHFYCTVFQQPNRTRHEWLRFFFTQGNALCHPSVLIRKRCYEECGSYRNGLMQLDDFDMWIRVCLRFEIHVMPEKLIKFRIRDNQANTSGPRPEVQRRTYYEFYHLLKHFAQIRSFRELERIFPEVKKYYRRNESNIEFALAQVALELRPFFFTELFGLELLYKLVNSPEQAAQLKPLYQFDYRNFNELAGRHNPFRVGLVEERERQIVSLQQTVSAHAIDIAALNTAVQERASQLALLRQTETELQGHIADLKKILEERDAHIAQLGNTVTTRDADNNLLRLMIAKKDEQITTLDNTSVEWQRQLGRLNQVIAELESRTGVLDQQVVDWEHKTAALNSAVAAHWERIQELTGILNQRESEIAIYRLENETYERQIASLKNKNVEQETHLNALNQTLAKRDAEIAALTTSIAVGEQALAERDTAIAALNTRVTVGHQALAERDAQVFNLEGQRDLLNAEIFRLNANSATFGAKIGRAITRVRGHVAPLGTHRGLLVTLAGKFGLKLLGAGPRAATAAAYHYISFRIRSKLAQRSALPTVRHNAKIDLVPGASAPVTDKKIHADHPQLAAWIAAHEPDEARLAEQKIDSERFGYQPMISVIVPVYRVPRDVLDETLASLEAQTYPKWEACIVWSDSEDLEGWNWMKARVALDARFKIKYLTENGGISTNSNMALELAEGEFIALLDHDDTLTPWAFYEVTKLLQTAPELDFIYSDKDSISADGQMRLNALYKPGWSPEMLHSVNYLTHLNVMRTSLIRDIGGWNSKTDGAQDWDIFFRITERTQHIARAPSILYHWRILPTSTATGLQAKPYAAMGQLTAQQNYFKRRGLPATVMPTPEGLFRVAWPLNPASADVFICQTGTLEQLINLLDVLRAGKQLVLRNVHVLHTSPVSEKLRAFEAVWPECFFLSACDDGDWKDVLTKVAHVDRDQQIVLVDGRACGLSADLVEELSGWVGHHPDVAWASAIAMNSDGTVYEAGRVVAQDYQSAPLFHGSPLFSFGWFGGPLWYRNARSVSPYAVAINAGDVHDVLQRMRGSGIALDNFSRFCMALAANGRRGLVNPFARAYFKKTPQSSWANEGQLYHDDPYFNPAFEQVSPLRLNS